MRIGPVGLRYHDNREKLLKAVELSCIVTHTHPLAIEGAKIIAISTAMAVNGSEPDEILGEIRGALKEPEYIRKADKIRELLVTPPKPEVAAHELGCSVKADESVPAALFAFLLLGADYTSAIRYAICMGGDTDTIAAMTGAMCGAKAGQGALPSTPLSALEGRERLRALAISLYNCWKKYR